MRKLQYGVKNTWLMRKVHKPKHMQEPSVRNVHIPALKRYVLKTNAGNMKYTLVKYCKRIP